MGFHQRVDERDSMVEKDVHYRLGFAGLGNRSRALIRAAAASGRFDVVAATSADAELASHDSPAAAEALQVGAQLCSSFDGLLAAGIDAVAIAVPNHRHKDLVAACVEAGVAVFLEKPIASSYGDTVTILASLADYTKPVHIGTELRYSPAAKDLLQARSEGRTAQLVWAQEFRDPFRPGVRGWRTSQDATGGTFVEKNCHHFDLFSLVLGDRPVRVTAYGQQAQGEPLHSAAAIIEFSRGAVGNLSVNMRQARGQLRWGALGEDWRYDYDSTSESSVEVVDGQERQKTWDVDTRGLDAGGWDHPGEVEQWVAFADKLDGKEPDEIDSHPHLWGHVISFAAEKSVKEGRTINIGPNGELS
jgi:predicted dehydrogenase